MNLNINDQVELFNNTLLNIFRNFIPHETIKCSSKDPPWMSKEIISALRPKNRVYKKYTLVAENRKMKVTCKKWQFMFQALLQHQKIPTSQILVKN